MRNGGRQKLIPKKRDGMQSRALVWVMVPLLALGAVYPPIHAAVRGGSLLPWVVPVMLSVGFAVLVWMLRTATTPASGIGLLVCMLLAQPEKLWRSGGSHRMALPALMTLFVLTFVATRFGRSKKEARDLAEKRSGRRASQIVANLGMAAVCAALGWYVGCIAALGEAAADTVSSEIGQAVGGVAVLITTGQKVPAGTDGGLSVAGSVAGMVAAAIVVAVGAASTMRWTDVCVLVLASCSGLFFDSVLGATVERYGWLGNDLVNFCSTLFSVALTLVWFLPVGKAL
jgi:uncharacterized protein (TIGR00297 family)